jgi:hypothetical protein
MFILPLANSFEICTDLFNPLASMCYTVIQELTTFGRQVFATFCQ